MIRKHHIFSNNKEHIEFKLKSLFLSFVISLSVCNLTNCTNKEISKTNYYEAHTLVYAPLPLSSIGDDVSCIVICPDWTNDILWCNIYDSFNEVDYTLRNDRNYFLHNKLYENHSVFQFYPTNDFEIIRNERMKVYKNTSGIKICLSDDLEHGYFDMPYNTRGGAFEYIVGSVTNN